MVGSRGVRGEGGDCLTFGGGRGRFPFAVSHAHDERHSSLWRGAEISCPSSSLLLLFLFSIFLLLLFLLDLELCCCTPGDQRSSRSRNKDNLFRFTTASSQVTLIIRGSARAKKASSSPSRSLVIGRHTSLRTVVKLAIRSFHRENTRLVVTSPSSVLPVLAALKISRQPGHRVCTRVSLRSTVSLDPESTPSL